METKTDASYGVVPVHTTGAGQWQVLVLNQRSVRGDEYWSFPKGHPEVGETGAAAALRELKEETGLIAVLDLSHAFSQQYSFTHDGVAIDKTVTYWIGEVTDTATVIQPAEVVEIRWVPFEEAHKLLTFAGSQAVLVAAAEHLGVTF